MEVIEMLRRTLYNNENRRRHLLSGRSMWHDLNRLQQDMNFLLGGTTAPKTATFPTLNVWENEDGLLLTAELPGLDVNDIEISVVGDTLTLNGERRENELPEGVKYHRRERGYGKFSRTVQLPYRIESNDVVAHFLNGVLTVTLPQAAADKPRKITVKSA
jgi:HSP20 family protein